jgi:hypothetical protein
MMTGIGTPISQSSIPLPKPIAMSSVFASVRASARRNVGRTKVFREVALFRPVEGRKLRLKARSKMDKRIASRSVFNRERSRRRADLRRHARRR